MPTTFLGTNGNDTITLSPNHNAATLNINGSTSNVTKVDTLTIQPLDGADNVEIGLVPSSAAKTVIIDLALAGGQPDGQADTVTFDDGSAGDGFTLTASGTGVQVVVDSFGN